MKRFGEGARRLAGAAAALLAWTPDQFWAATPAEMMDALRPPGDDGEPADRAAVDALMRRFPDVRGQ